MDRNPQTLLILMNRVIGPAFLIVGLLVTLFMLESQALPLVKHALANGITPEFGLVVIKVGAPLLVAYCTVTNCDEGVLKTTGMVADLTFSITP